MSETDFILESGTVLDSGERKYSIVKSLGQGGFGITYLAVGEVIVDNVPVEAKFAIKEHFPFDYARRVGVAVLPKSDKTEEYERSKTDFIAEARKLHALGTENDNIVKVNEVFEANGTAYYVMMYINGSSLVDYVEAAKKKRLRWSEAIEIMTPIFDAVGFLHKSRINHLDVKPENIMLHNGSNGMVPILIDFGLSIHFKKSGGKTSPKCVMGVSPGYSPMEQYVGIKEFTPEADIYSLAATLLFALTGSQPKDASDLRLSEIREQLKDTVPADAIEGICKAMNKSFDDRTHSVAALKCDLGITSGSSRGKTEVIDIEEDDRKRRRNLLFGAAGIIIVAVLCILFWPKGGTSEPNAVPADTAAAVQTSDTPEERRDSVAPVPAVPVTPQPPEATPDTKPQPTPQPRHDAAETKQNHMPAAPAVTTGTLSLGYATWSGGIKGGKPHGPGRLTFNSAHAVDRSTSEQAASGDYFNATYDSGSLISGKLYDSEGNLKKTIIP